ncbi:uncharacterized protein LOC121973341 [Zingiber officinale]|uniref:Uncharacterized protein n=1 Tax=Zingiber officinale TaxID=94328 RepID=A0A8J5L698_ZINOF|nr:uncharacterized protein LOC121973341 [Zingiber officinale]KAG6514170.1 hypothetical protein ZIOFF_024511 [Zingiber officinale]
MNALKALQLPPIFFVRPNASVAHRTKPPAGRRRRSLFCFCTANDAGGSSSSEGDKRRQELLARIAMLQTQKVRVTEFLDERSAYLTQFAEEANAELEQIGEKALKDLDEASARILEKLESRAQAIDEAAEVNRQEMEQSEKVLEEFEEQMERDRNEGLFFKSLREKSPVTKEKTAKAAREEARRLEEVGRRSAAASNIRRNIYLALMVVLAVTIGNAVLVSPEVEWRKVAALGLIFVGLLAQLVYEKSLASEEADK